MVPGQQAQLRRITVANENQNQTGSQTRTVTEQAPVPQMAATSQADANMMKALGSLPQGGGQPNLQAPAAQSAVPQPVFTTQQARPTEASPAPAMPQTMHQMPSGDSAFGIPEQVAPAAPQASGDAGNMAAQLAGANPHLAIGGAPQAAPQMQVPMAQPVMAAQPAPVAQPAPYQVPAGYVLVPAAPAEQPMAKACSDTPTVPPTMAVSADQAKANGGKTDKLKKMKDGEEDDEMEEDGEKSVALGDLLKSATILNNMASGASSDGIVTDRRATLAKGWADGSLSEDDREEFQNLMKSEMGVEDDDEPLDKSFEGMVADDPLIKSELTDEDGNDISGWIQRISQFMAGGLDMNNATMSKGFTDQDTLIKGLSKVVVGLARHAAEQDNLLKGMAAHIEATSFNVAALAGRPAPRISTPNVQALDKSLFHGTGGGGDGQPQGQAVSRDDMIKGLNQLTRENPNDMAPCGESIGQATATYEMHGQMSKSMQNDVLRTLGRIQ